MSLSSPKLPAGYRLVRLETTDSTNAEAMRARNAGEPGPLWVWSAPTILRPRAPGEGMALAGR